MKRGEGIRIYLKPNVTAEELDAFCSEQPSARSHLSCHSMLQRQVGNAAVAQAIKSSCARTVFRVDNPATDILDAVHERAILLTHLDSGPQWSVTKPDDSHSGHGHLVPFRSAPAVLLMNWLV
jgi:hypothetical protein